MSISLKKKKKKMELGSRPINYRRVFHLHEGLVRHWKMEGLEKFFIWKTTLVTEPLQISRIPPKRQHHCPENCWSLRPSLFEQIEAERLKEFTLCHTPIVGVGMGDASTPGGPCYLSTGLLSGNPGPCQHSVFLAEGQWGLENRSF